MGEGPTNGLLILHGVVNPMFKSRNTNRGIFSGLKRDEQGKGLTSETKVVYHHCWSKSMTKG